MPIKVSSFFAVGFLGLMCLVSLTNCTSLSQFMRPSEKQNSFTNSAVNLFMAASQAGVYFSLCLAGSSLDRILFIC